MPDIRTVRAARDDLEALVPLFDAYRSFYGRPADEAGARAFLAERLTRGESVVFLAVALARPIGFTQLYPSFSSVRLGRLWILNDLFVLPEARRSGAGRALLERAERWAAETGAVGLTLATQLTNESARRLYGSCGWVQDTEFLHYTRILEPRPRGPGR
jgi:GNAT superfamily N-acetyltransferase